MITRILQENISKKLFKGKVILILGARQTGKTTLLKQLFSGSNDILWLNGDETDVQNAFENPTSTRLLAYVGNKSAVIIDEAQRIKNIGLALKLLYDNKPELQIVATGSSAFELANEINEPLTGRKWEFQMFPISFAEMVNYHGLIQEKRLLNHRLIYGYYPEVILSQTDEKNILHALTDSYLYKDILLWERIKKPEKLIKLLQALALQIGHQVSYNEIGKMIGLDNQTVENYIVLLEQTFIIFRLKCLTRNYRNELKHSRKIYFYDNGIRNALLANFNQVELRTDIGALWENYLIAERQKFIHYQNLFTNIYFWRTKEQNEIDYIEERDGHFFAYEFKWNKNSKYHVAKTWTDNYQGVIPQVITPANYDGFLL